MINFIAMKAFMIIAIIALMSNASLAQAQAPEVAYDSTLAKSLGADAYGMKMYVFVLLKTGSNTVTEKAVRDSLFAGHFANMDRMVKAGQLVVAGPMEKNEEGYRGIFILNVPDFAAAEALLQNDPAIKEKVLEPMLYHWYGSAALPLYLDDHKRIQAEQIE